MTLLSARSRLTVVVAVACLVLGVMVPASAAAAFEDVPDGHVFAADIDFLATAEITRGCNPPANTRFCPDDGVTRGQMAAFLVRALSLPSVGDQGFTDTAGSVFAANIDALAAAGITKGCNPPDNSRFCPDDPVTRGQMAAFLRRALTMTTTSKPVASVSAGHLHTCAAAVDGTAYCWGANNDGQLGLGHEGTGSSRPAAVVGLSDVFSISAGGTHTCASTGAGELYCWGEGANGRLGNGGTDPKAIPTLVTSLVGVVDVQAAENFTCALREDFTVWCWGFGIDGHLGNGASASSNVPVQVSGVNDAVSLSVGYSHSCVTTTGGEVKCWGSTGRPGDGSTGDIVTTPVTAAGLADVVEVSAGQRHTCAVTEPGAVYCWGFNGAGQLGQGDVDVRAVPTLVSGVGGATSVDAGSFQTCAVTPSGTWCWGDNANGGLALGSTGPDRLTPVKSLIAGATAIDHAYDHACSVSTSQDVTCWGSNMLGQLGIGTTGAVVATPQAVTVGG